MPSPRAELAWRFLGRFAILFGLLLVLGLPLSVFPRTERVLARAAVGLLSWARDDGIVRTLYLKSTNDERWYVYDARPGGANVVWTDRFLYHQHGQNLWLFAAMVLATPALGWRLRALALAGGLVLIAALDLVTLLGDLWAYERRLPAYAGSEPGLGLRALSLVHAFHPTGGIYMLPLFLWALVIAGGLRAGGLRTAARRAPSPRR